jgi:hypothetical protein
MQQLGETEEFQSWHQQAERAVTAMIAKDPHGPHPAHGQRLRCYLRDGQVIDGLAARIWLDLDIVRIDVRPLTVQGEGIFRITPAEGDGWELK